MYRNNIFGQYKQCNTLANKEFKLGEHIKSLLKLHVFSKKSLISLVKHDTSGKYKNGN